MHKATNYSASSSNHILHDLCCQYASLSAATLDSRLGRQRDGAHHLSKRPHSRRISGLRSLLQNGGPSKLLHLCMNPTPFHTYSIIHIIATLKKIPLIFRALPALTIHTLVAQSAKLFKRSLNPRAKAWGPTLTGLAAVPILPYLYDAPVEAVTDKVFEWCEERWYERRAKAKMQGKPKEE